MEEKKNNLQEPRIDWDLMQLYMKVLSLKGSFEKAKREYEEFILKCNKSIYDCEIMLEEINRISHYRD